MMRHLDGKVCAQPLPIAATGRGVSPPHPLLGVRISRFESTPLNAHSMLTLC